MNLKLNKASISSLLAAVVMAFAFACTANGQVTVSYNQYSGELEIVGSSANDWIRIKSGYPMVSVEGLYGTKVNNKNAVFYHTRKTAGFKSINCFMGDGDDVLWFNDVSSYGNYSISVDGDNGQDLISLEDSRITGNFTATNVGYYVGISSTDIWGSLYLEMDNVNKYSAQASTCFVDLVDSYASVTTIAGSYIKSRNDFTLEEFETSICKMTTGRQSDLVDMHNVEIGDLAISTGGANDEVRAGSDLGGVISVDSFNVILAGGNDTVRFDTGGTTFSLGDIYIDGGTGVDRVIDSEDIYTFFPSGTTLIDIEWENLFD